MPAPAVVVKLAETATLHDGEAAGEGRAGGARSARARRLAGHLLYPRTPTFFVRPVRLSPRVSVRQLAVWHRMWLSAHHNVRAAVIIVMCGVSRESYGCVRARARRGRKFMATAACTCRLSPGHERRLAESKLRGQDVCPQLLTQSRGQDFLAATSGGQICPCCNCSCQPTNRGGSGGPQGVGRGRPQALRDDRARGAAGAFTCPTIAGQHATRWNHEQVRCGIAAYVR